MKSGFALWCALSLLLGSIPCPGIETAPTTPVPSVPPAPSIIADDQFFVDHPDLKDEAEVVGEASKALAADGFQAGAAKQASDALAAKARAILAERTPEEWQQKAVNLYPALGVAGSEFNLLFRKHYRELAASSPTFIQEPSWPVLLAERCDDELRAGSPSAAKTLSAPPSQAAHPDGKHSASQRHRSGHFWQTTFALLLLIILTALPGALAFQKGRQRPTLERTPAPKSDPPLWRNALKHAAVIYVLASLPASIHSLMANSDLGFMDRLFVSLLVGSLFGLFIALPLYGIDTLWHACQKHPARPATR